MINQMLKSLEHRTNHFILIYYYCLHKNLISITIKLRRSFPQNTWQQKGNNQLLVRRAITRQIQQLALRAVCPLLDTNRKGRKIPQ
jgi:hypothetical protein